METNKATVVEVGDSKILLVEREIEGTTALCLMVQEEKTPVLLTFEDQGEDLLIPMSEIEGMAIDAYRQKKRKDRQENATEIDEASKRG